MEGRGEKAEAKKGKIMKKHSELSKFFYPESIAIVGVSPEPSNLGKTIVQNCLTFGYQGEILSVGLRGGVVFGQRIHSSLLEIDRQVDLAVILTPAKTIPGILEQCGQKGIKWVVIESAGFSEMGEQGKPLERACLEISRKHGIRFIGPNGVGVTNLEKGLALPFWPLRHDLSLGPVSILAQSGGVGVSYLSFLAEENIGINKFVSMGNKLDVDENDLLEYLIEDKGTRIILLYLEGFTDGKRFMKIAARSTKPILVHKSNRFKTSSQIAHSHTAALFADDMLVDQALEQVGCLRVNTMNDALDCVKSLTLPPLKGRRLAVVSRSGGHAVIAADACAYYGFSLARFPQEILKKIESKLRAHVIRLQNPLDLGDLFELEFYEQIIEGLLSQDGVDGVLLGHGYRRGFEEASSRQLIKKVADLTRRYQKPVALVVFAEAVEIDYLKRNVNIPVYTAPENAMRAFYLSYKWASRKPPRTKRLYTKGIKRQKAKKILLQAEKKPYLSLKQSMDFLQRYGFSVPPHGIARSAEEAIRIWDGIASKVAIKINNPHFSHKTDAGAIMLNLNSKQEIISACKELTDVAGPDAEFLVQAMTDKGLECILGGKQDDVFGPVVIFGLGGIFVEAIRDVVYRVAPINYNTAANMITKIRGKKILEGLRGKEPYDVDAIADLLVRLSEMLVDFPSIREIDINPVMVFPKGKGATAIDARVILEPESAPRDKR